MIDILEEVFKTGEMIENDRDVQSVFLAVSEETGELAREVRVLTAHDCYKEAGEDGILGESCDVVIATLDLLFISGYTKEQVRDTITKKLNKWYEKTEGNKETTIRINTFQEMRDNGCFIVDGDLMYDGNEKVKNEKDYEEIDADYEVMHIWNVLFEHELSTDVFGKEITIKEEELTGEFQDDFLCIETNIGTVQIPNIEGVFYERC
ncbi:MAG: hypothetical protein ACRCZ2_00580 [Fusobacteriaceae bacterium]